MRRRDDTTAEATAAASPKRTRWATVATSALATLLVASELSMAAFALPLIGRDLDVGTSATAWVLLAYQLPLAALALPAGRWVDRADVRLVFTASLLALTAAGVLAGLAPQFWVLLAARVLQGFAAAGYLAVYLPVVSAAVRSDQRGRAMSYHATIMMVGSVAIAPVGGWLADAHGWRAVFLVRIPLLLLAAVLGWLAVPATRPRLPTGDVAGPAPADGATRRPSAMPPRRLSPYCSASCSMAVNSSALSFVMTMFSCKRKLASRAASSPRMKRSKAPRSTSEMPERRWTSHRAWTSVGCP